MPKFSSLRGTFRKWARCRRSNCRRYPGSRAASCERWGLRFSGCKATVTDDKIYCVYLAPDEDAVRKHAQQGGFPANRISQIRSVIDPTTAE